MSDHRISPWRPTNDLLPKDVTEALGGELSAVVHSQRAEFSIGFWTSVVLLLLKLALASQGTVVTDDRGRKIPLAFRVIFEVAHATGHALRKWLVGLLSEVQAAGLPEATAQIARLQADQAIRAQAVQRLRTDIKLATDKAVKLAGFQSQLTTILEKEPTAEAFPDFEPTLLAWENQVAECELNYDQAKLDGDQDLAKSVRQEVQQLRDNRPKSFEAEHKRWRLQHASLVARMEPYLGAQEELDRVSKQLAELLAMQGREQLPSLPKLVHVDAPVAVLRKAVDSGCSTTTAVYQGDAFVKTLRKQPAALAELLDMGTRTQVGLIAFVPLGCVKEIVQKVGDMSVPVLGHAHIVADRAQGESDIGPVQIDLDRLSAFDHDIREQATSNLLAMLDRNFTAAVICLEPAAAALLVEKRASLHTFRTTAPQHPVIDTYLSLMPETIFQVAGLLYRGRGESGPLSAQTIQDAITLCHGLDREFASTAVPEPPEMAHVQVLRQALQGHVVKATQQEDEKPFAIQLAKLCNKSNAIGLTKPQIRKAVLVMRDMGLVRIKQDGLGLVVELDPMHFGSPVQP